MSDAYDTSFTPQTKINDLNQLNLDKKELLIDIRDLHEYETRVEYKLTVSYKADI